MSLPPKFIRDDDYVYVWYNKIDRADMEALVAYLDTDTNVSSLTFNRTPVHDEATFALADFIRRNTTIKRINFETIGEAGICAIAEALKSNSTVDEMYLSPVTIGDAGGAAIADMLRVNTTLRKLVLVHQYGGDIGVKAIAHALTYNYTLRELCWCLDTAKHIPRLQEVASYIVPTVLLQYGIDTIPGSGPHNMGRRCMLAFMEAENSQVPAGAFVRACGDRGVLRIVLNFLV